MAGNIVRVKATQEIVYRQIPSFEDGKGIANVLIRKANYTEAQLEEALINEADLISGAIAG